MWYKVEYYLNGHPRSRMVFADSASKAESDVKEKFTGAVNIKAYPDYNYIPK